MIKTTAIRNDSDFMVIWDTGKRCNFDCSYCSSNRHTLDSDHAELSDLIATYHFVKQWVWLYDSHRKNPRSEYNIDFTGGEPTANPEFWNLLKYIKNDDPSVKLGVTSNGSWGEKHLELLIEHIRHATISIHFEEAKIVKNKVLRNIIKLNKHMSMSVNVMMHIDYWDEMIETCNVLDSEGVKYNLVPIGDSHNDVKTWFADSRGIMRRTAQEYTIEQQQWFFKQKGLPLDTDVKTLGSKLGRSCCGGRCMEAKVDNQWQPVKFINTEFADWYCMVDWFFLHIDQELREVTHHQTCRALRGKQTGVIGSLDNGEQLLQELAQMLSRPIEPIRCPNARCGCGMCVPKAAGLQDFQELYYARANVPIQEILL